MDIFASYLLLFWFVPSLFYVCLIIALVFVTQFFCTVESGWSCCVFAGSGCCLNVMNGVVLGHVVFLFYVVLHPVDSRFPS